ncbi:MAG: outer membrane beta-barrel protein [Bacteroidetes bacterium]|nr:outer membrane beta-barrel protein [Bacteroidota bacterium]
MKSVVRQLLLAAAFFASGTSAFAACDDSTKTYRYDRSDNYHFWEGLDIGMVGFANPQRTLGLPAGYEFLELDYARSHVFALNIWQHNFHIYRNNVNLVTGFGMEWNSYAFRNNASLIADTNRVAATIETRDYTKNKLKMFYVNVPLMLEFNTNNNNHHRSFHVAAGGLFSYNVFENRLKQEYEMDGQTQERKVKDDFNINPFRYGLTARIGYGEYTLFANYALSEVFRDNAGPSLNHYSIGLHINL